MKFYRQNNFKMKKLLLIVILLMSVNVYSQQNTLLVRILEIEIYPEFLEEYNAILNEEVSISMNIEKGVIAIIPMQEEKTPTEFTLLEIYADQDAYQSHLKTPHFQYYKTTTLKMVKSLTLITENTIKEETLSRIFNKIKQ